MATIKALGLGTMVVVVSGCQSWQFRDFEDLPPTAADQASEPGIIKINYFDNISGSKIADMLNNPAFPDSPTAVIDSDRIEFLDNRGDNYGAYVRGFIVPPVNGDYQFYVAGDDETEFWLSNDETSENISRMATVPGYTSRNEFDKYASQASPVVPMQADTSYYFEVRFKEGSGNDHFSVAWQGPNLSRQIVAAPHIASWGILKSEPSLTTAEAYTLGYRVGHFDGRQNLSFNDTYPPLDQDGDGLYDNWEVHHGLNPSDAGDALSDNDNDYLTAFDEFQLGTNPSTEDTDSDGIPDGIEFLWELDPLDPNDAEGDLDNDGFSNVAEYRKGTDPKDPTDVPELEPEYIAGFAGQYFDGKNFDRFVRVRVEPEIDFGWGREQPIPELPADNFSVRWSGIFSAPHTEGTNEYRFTATTDDGVRLYADDQIMVNDWSDHGAKSFSFNSQLRSGENLPIVIEYYESLYGAVARFSITNVSTGQALSIQDTITTIDPASDHSTDSDGDGIPDTWELKHGLAPLTNDAANVVNNAGVTNLDAYNSGLDPWTLGETGSPPAQSDGTETAPTVESGTVTLTWSAPGTRMDGSSLSLAEIDHYEIRYGQSQNSLSEVEIVGGQETNFTFSNLDSGTWYFTISVVDIDGLKSAPSEIVSHEVP